MKGLHLHQMAANDRDITVAISLKDLRSFFREIIADMKKKLYPEYLLPARQVCEILSVDDSTLRRWEKNRTLIPIKVGNRRRFRVDDIRKITNGVDMTQKTV